MRRRTIGPFQLLGRFAQADRVRPCLIDRRGIWRDLSYVLLDITPDALQPVEIDILLSIEPETLPEVTGDGTMLEPVGGLGRIHADCAGGPLRLAPNTERIRDPSGFRVGLAAVVGASGPWSGAIMTATVAPGDGTVTLGRCVGVADNALDAAPIACAIQTDDSPPTVGRFARDALRQALARASRPELGDIVLATIPVAIAADATEIRVDFPELGAQARSIGTADRTPTR